MADKIAKRGVSIFIDGKEVKNSVAGISNEMRKLQGEQRKMTIGSDEYVAHARKIEYLKKMHLEHIQNQRTIAQEYGNMKKESEGSLSKMANGFNKYFAIVTAGVAAFTGLTLGLKKFMDMRNELEDSQANLKSLTGMDDSSIAWLTEEARKLSTQMTDSGVRIRKTSKEIVDAFTVVGSAKPELLKNKEALKEVTEQAMILAEASKMELGDAVRGLTIAMNMYGASASEAAKYTNVLGAGAKEGAAEVSSQTESILKAGVAASQAGIPIEQLVGSIQALAEKGIKDEIAGTGMKSFFIKLQSGADDTNPKIVGLQKALENLAAKNLSSAELQKQFGLETYTVASALILSAEKVKTYTTAVTGTNIALEQAQINSKTVAAKMAQAKNEFSEAGMELVKNMNPAILTATNFTTKFIKLLVQLPKWLSENKGLLLTLAVASIAYAVAINRARIASALWYASEKLKIGLASISKALEFAHVAALRVRIAVTGQATIAELRLVAAQKAMNATMLLNVYVAVAAAIAAISYGVYKLATRTTDAQKAMKEFNQEAATQQRELNNIFEAYKKANPKTAEKARLLAIIKEKYGPYIKDLINEKGEIINIEKAQLQANKALAQSIALKTKNKYIDENAAKEIEYQAGKMTELRDELVTDKGSSLADVLVGEVGAIFQKNINDPLKAGTKEAFALLDKYKLMSGPLDRKNYGEIINGIASSFYRMNMKTKEFDAVFKGLIGDFKVVDDLMTTTDAGGDADGTGGTGGSGGTSTPAADKGLKAKEDLKSENAKLSKEMADASIDDLQRTLDFARLVSAEQLAGVKQTLDQEHALKLKQLGEDKQLELNKADLSLQSAEDIGKQKKLIEQKYRTLTAEEDAKFAADTANVEKQQQLKVLSDKLASAAHGSQEAFDLEKQMREIAMDEELALVEKGSAAAQAIREKYRKMDEDAENTLLKTKQEMVFQYANAGMEVFSSLNSFVGALGDRELANFKKQNKNKANFDEEYAQKKAEIEIKAAKRAKMMAAFSTIINTASAVLGALAPPPVGLGPVLGIPFAVAAGASGALQLATILAAPLPEYFTGGFTGSGGKYEPKGVVHGNEFVANSDALANPNLLPVFNAIDQAQRMGTVRNLKPKDFKRALGQENTSAVSGVRQRPSDSGNAQVPVSTLTALNDALLKVHATNSALVSELEKGIEAKYKISGDDGVVKGIEKYNKLIKIGQR